MWLQNALGIVNSSYRFFERCLHFKAVEGGRGIKVCFIEYWKKNLINLFSKVSRGSYGDNAIGYVQLDVQAPVQ